MRSPKGIARRAHAPEQDPGSRRRASRSCRRPAGAVVVLDVARRLGASRWRATPTYAPSWWVGGISPGRLHGLNDPGAHFPLLNRATAGPVRAGLDVQARPVARHEHVRHTAVQRVLQRRRQGVASETTGFYNDKSAPQRRGRPVAGAHRVERRVLLHGRRRRSGTSGTPATPHAGSACRRRHVVSVSARRPGIEIDEAAGPHPGPHVEAELRQRESTRRRTEKRDNGRWYPGDDVHLAVGQGDVLVTPLQLANAYATFANGGTLRTPHVGMTDQGREGSTWCAGSHRSRNARSPLDPALRAQMLARLQERRAERSRPAGRHRVQRVPGLSLRQHAGRCGRQDRHRAGCRQGPDVACSLSFFPADNPEYVVLAVVEEGGHGAEIAAPIVRQVIEHMQQPGRAADADPRTSRVATDGRRSPRRSPAAAPRPTRASSRTSTSCSSRSRSRSAGSGC